MRGLAIRNKCQILKGQAPYIERQSGMSPTLRTITHRAEKHMTSSGHSALSSRRSCSNCNFRRMSTKHNGYIVQHEKTPMIRSYCRHHSSRSELSSPWYFPPPWTMCFFSTMDNAFAAIRTMRHDVSGRCIGISVVYGCLHTVHDVNRTQPSSTHLRHEVLYVILQLVDARAHFVHSPKDGVGHLTEATLLLTTFGTSGWKGRTCRTGTESIASAKARSDRKITFSVRARLSITRDAAFLHCGVRCGCVRDLEGVSLVSYHLDYFLSAVAEANPDTPAEHTQRRANMRRRHCRKYS